MSKRLNLFFLTCVMSLLVHAQWSRKDSLDLQQSLKSNEEIPINKDVLKDIHFNPFTESPKAVTEKPALKYDVTLPKVYPDKGELKLSLRPYTANTKFNYDPIYRKKIKVGADTWKDDPFSHFGSLFIYSNWAKKPTDAGLRKSLGEIEASGQRYNPLAERVNNTYVGKWSRTADPSNIDLMTPFTKDFWDRAGRKRRARTLEVLQNYGDSTTVLVKEEIKKPIMR